MAQIVTTHWFQTHMLRQSRGQNYFGTLLYNHFMVIFINGSINSGKSTISKLLQKKIKKTAIVEIDSLRAFIEWMPIEEAIPINLQNAVDVIKNFDKQGLNVIVPYPLSQDNYNYFVENLDDLSKLIFITLSPNLDTVLKNRGDRDLSEWETNRIKHHYKIGINKPDFGEIIDNSELTLEETVDIINRYINEL